MPTAPEPALDFDPAVVREKYREERDKRAKPLSNGPSTDTTGDLRLNIADPYLKARLTRAAVHEEVEVLIVGGGFGGLIAAAQLRHAGIDNFRIIETAGDFGGTWYWNRYPGVQCDIESYIYMPLLEETGYIPKEKYAYGPEILEHCQRIGRSFDLYKTALFQTQVKAMHWNEAITRWIVTTDRDDVIKARFVITASGPLNAPKLPGIPGIAEFKGHIFHTSRWDYAYTGGDNRGGMHKLADKHVAVIGTGATGIQCVPFLGQSAKQLYVFQRTPSTVDVRGNAPTDQAWVKSLTPGWQQRRMLNFNTLVGGGHQDEDLVHDGWTDIFRKLRTAGARLQAQGMTPAEIAKHLELADLRKGNQIRARIDSIVRDPQTAESLKSWYPMFCKRPTFNDEYLPTFNRPNVKLVDTQGRGVERVTANALMSGGVAYEVDCIVLATGFETETEKTHRAGFEVVGCDGLTLSSKAAEGLKTLHGFFSHRFPNYFNLGIGQNGFKPNFTDMLGEQATHVVNLLAYMKSRHLTRIEPTAQAEAEWTKIIHQKARDVRAFLSQCTPGYYNGEGDVNKGLLIDCYGGGSLEFSKILDEWLQEGQMAGLALS